MTMKDENAANALSEQLMATFRGDARLLSFIGSDEWDAYLAVLRGAIGAAAAVGAGAYVTIARYGDVMMSSGGRQLLFGVLVVLVLLAAGVAFRCARAWAWWREVSVPRSIVMSAKIGSIAWSRAQEVVLPAVGRQGFFAHKDLLAFEMQLGKGIDEALRERADELLGVPAEAPRSRVAQLRRGGTLTHLAAFYPKELSLEGRQDLLALASVGQIQRVGVYVMLMLWFGALSAVEEQAWAIWGVLGVAVVAWFIASARVDATVRKWREADPAEVVGLALGVEDELWRPYVEQMKSLAQRQGFLTAENLRAFRTSQRVIRGELVA